MLLDTAMSGAHTYARTIKMGQYCHFAINIMYDWNVMAMSLHYWLMLAEQTLTHAPNVAS